MDWRTVRDLLLVGLVMVIGWVLILLLTFFLAGLVVDLLGHLDHTFSQHQDHT